MNPAREPFVPTLHDGIVSAVDAKTGWVRVRLPDFDHLLTNWLQCLFPVTKDNQVFQTPAIDTPVAVLLDGSGETGFVLGAYYNEITPVPQGASPTVWVRRFADGAVLQYDHQTHALQAILPAGGTVVFDAPGGGTLRGDWKVEGRLDVAKEIAAKGRISSDDDVLAKDVSLHDHPHGDVQHGTDTSGKPLPSS